MSLSSEFLALAADPFDEAMQTRLYVVLNDYAGGTPFTRVLLTTDQSILSINPIVRRREREFGVIQGQSWQVRITNIDLAVSGYDLRGCWAAIMGGFPVADEWELLAQGKISTVQTSTDGTVTFEVHDSVMDILNFTLPRDITFQDTGWISDMATVAKASGSGSYLTTQAITLGTPTTADDETFIIEFTSTTAFKVILEDGTSTQTGNVTTDCAINNLAADANITIPYAGWSGTFAIGDKFEFFTARPRTSSELTPVYMIIDLIDSVAGLSTYSVLDGSYYSNVRYDTSNWSNLASDHDNKEIGGFWKKGTQVSRLIQDALKLIHGAVYPTESGQIAIWAIGPSDGVAVELNGNPGNGNVDILGVVARDNIGNAVSEVTFDYLSLDGEAASYTAIDSDTALLEPIGKVIDIGWWVDGASIEDACDRYLTRFADGVVEYEIDTTLAGVAAEIGRGVAIIEGELGISSLVVDTTDVEVDLFGNTVKIKAHTSPLVLEDYFMFNDSLLNGAEVLW